MTGTYVACLHRNQSRSYLNHLVFYLQLTHYMYINLSSLMISENFYVLCIHITQNKCSKYPPPESIAAWIGLSRTAAPFQGTQAGCDRFDRQKKCHGEMSIFSWT